MIEQLGPYRLDKQIGRGGMGAVYSGVNEETGETAAIKILAAAFAEDPGFRSRFLTEIETLKQLRHKNIVQLFGDGEQDGQLFYVMELVEGQSLQEELQAGHKYDWEETTQIAIQICQALKHAHDHGVIHRDLKPANLLRAPDDQIKLTDFGIAKLFGGSHLTAAGSVVGTADFMSPEQAEGLGVTNRSDLYSLGAVMFTLLARRPPFAGASLPQVVHRLRFEEAPSVRRFAPQVPAELEQIINQLLCKAPEDRVATALVLANRLRAMKHGLANRGQTDGAEAGGEFSKPATPPTPSDEQATRISKSSRGPNTELNPTAVDDFELRADVQRASGADSWNDDATMATGEEAARAADSKDDAGKNAGRDGLSNSQPTVVESPEPVNRFTTIEADQYRKRQETADEPAKWREASKVVAMVVALIVVIGAAAWGLKPVSADRLYSKIIEIKATATIEDAEKQIDAFLKKFPDDSRAGEVKDFQLGILSERLALNLSRHRRNPIGPVERKYVQAMKDRVSDPASAREDFLELLREEVSQPATDDVRRCIQYARYQLGQLSQLPEETPQISP